MKEIHDVDTSVRRSRETNGICWPPRPTNAFLEISSIRFYPVFVPYELALHQGEDPALRRHLRKKATPLF